MKTLVIVDVQQDFYSKSGKLYVNGAERLPQKIVKEIKDNDYDNVILTIDSHPYNHCSFISQGGEWSSHCIKGSEGAGVADSIIDALIETETPFYIFEKGTDSMEEEYGAFKHFKLMKNGLYKFFYNNENNKEIYNTLVESDIVEICGIAEDYCLMETIKEMMTFVDKDKIKVNRKCSKSIDDGTTFTNFLNETNIEVIN